MTLDEEILLIDEAIESILKRGVSYSISGITYTKANLGELYDRKAKLNSLKYQQKNKGLNYVKFTPM